MSNNEAFNAIPAAEQSSLKNPKQLASNATSNLEGEIEKWKNNTLSAYCLDKCRVNCCSFKEIGHQHPILSKEELRAIFMLKPEDKISKKTVGIPVIKSLLKRAYYEFSGAFLFIERINKYGDNEFGLTLKTCPAYNNGKCDIYENPNKPGSCRRYPIYTYPEQKILKISMKCSGVLKTDTSKITDSAQSSGYQIVRY